MRLALALALLSLGGCSLAGPDIDIDSVRSPDAPGGVVNRTGEAIAPLAVDAETAALIDLASEYTLAEDELVVPAGEAAALPIEGYDDGEDVVVFVFRVRGRTATYAGSLPISADEFERSDAVVTVRRLDP